MANEHDLVIQQPRAPRVDGNLIYEMAIWITCEINPDAKENPLCRMRYWGTIGTRRWRRMKPSDRRKNGRFGENCYTNEVAARVP